MAKYDFVNDKTGETFHLDCPMNDYKIEESKLIKKGFRRSYVANEFLTDRRDIYSKADDGWKETLQRVKSGSGRRNTIPII